MIHMKKLVSFLVAFAVIFLVAFPASAHVTVNPSSSTTESWEAYSVKVPVEKDLHTTKVTLKIPSNIEYKMYEAVEGWKVTTSTDDNENVTSVTWEAETKENGIKPGEYRIFTFTAQNPAEAGEIIWDAFQYYEDGSIVEWTGESDSELPHSVTTIEKSDASVDSHGTSVKNESTKANDSDSQSNEESGLHTTLSIIAIILSLIAIALTFIRKK
ncbi:MAG TPA: DUF1775 domain-containing protein [Niallia sp.]|nr:DUF1775 domain-containing protein [Niallia sp.]